MVSSGDLIADRRAAYAAMLREGGDAPAAAEVMAQALDLVPDWAAGWYQLGLYHEQAGETGAAIAAWARAAELDVSGRLGAQMRLAAAGAADLEAQAQAAYAEALFDAYAGSFDVSLVQALGYRVPEALAALLQEAMATCEIAGFGSCLDLGCGTGLMGDRIRLKVSHLAGVDLSAAMVAETRRRGVYDAVAQGELAAYLLASERQPDLVTAADVFMYCAALPPIFSAVYRVLVPGGLFAFSVETHEGPEPQVLRPSLRLAHNADAVLDGLRAAGFAIVARTQTVLRFDRGAPVQGLLAVVRKPMLSDAPLAVAGAAPEERVLLQ